MPSWRRNRREAPEPSSAATGRARRSRAPHVGYAAEDVRHSARLPEAARSPACANALAEDLGRERQVAREI